MSQSVLMELQQLKDLLSAPVREEFRRTSSSNTSPGILAAQESVENLSHALEAGKEGVEEAVKGAAVVHRQSAAQREQEVQELRRVVAARERSLESLRATLDSTKHFLEERLAHANQSLAAKETEGQAMHLTMLQCLDERDTLAKQLEEKSHLAQQLHDQLQEDAEDRHKQRQEEVQQQHYALEAQEQEIKHLKQDLATARDQIQEAEQQAGALREEVEAEWGAGGREREEGQRHRRRIHDQEETINHLEIKLQEAEERLEARDRVVSGLHQQLSEKQLHFKKLRSFLKADLQSRGELERLILTAQEMLLNGKAPSKSSPKQPRKPTAAAGSGNRSPARAQPAKKSTHTSGHHAAGGDGRQWGPVGESADDSRGRRAGDEKQPTQPHKAGCEAEKGEEEAGENSAEQESESGSFRSTNSSPEVQLDVEFSDTGSHQGRDTGKPAATPSGQGASQQSPMAERLDKELVKLRLVLQEHMGRRTVA